MSHAILGVALLRVSTDRQFQEGESIETQKRKIDLAASRERIDLVRYFTEHYSGRKEDRLVLEEMFQFLTENRDIRAVIVGDIDRFTRGGSDIYLTLKRRLRDLDVRLIDTSGIIQPERNRLEHLGVEYEWSRESPSRYAEVFMAEKARAEASDILTRVIGQEIQLTREGYQVRPPNFGYQNQKITTQDGRKKTIMVPNEAEAVFVRRMFEWRADSVLTDNQICERINAMGYQSRGSNRYDPLTRKLIGQSKPKPLNAKQLQRMLRRVIYCGVRNEKWNNGQPILAPVEPLVSVELFNRANRGDVVVEIPEGAQAGDPVKVRETLETYKNFKDTEHFLLRHVVLCPKCRKPFLGSFSKGKRAYVGYYHCSRKHSYLGINAKEFEETIGNLLDELRLKPSFLNLFREIARDVWMRKQRGAAQERNDLDDHIAQLRERQNALLDRLLTCNSPLVQSRMEQEVEELEQSIQNAQGQHNSTRLKEAEIEAYFEFAKTTLEHPRRYVFLAKSKPDMLKRWSAIFAGPSDWQNLIDRTPELSLIYRLNRQSDCDQNLLVTQLLAEWNTFESEVRSAIPLYSPSSFSAQSCQDISATS